MGDHNANHMSIHAPLTGERQAHLAAGRCRYPISIRTPHERSDDVVRARARDLSDFNPCSLWGSDYNDSLPMPPDNRFNPRSPWESDAFLRCLLRMQLHFQSTLSVGERLWKAILQCICLNFNPRSPWGERPAGPPPGPGFQISIHALRGESDYCS